MKLSLLALVLGFILDLIIGDPHGLYHPIRLVGNLIGFLEKHMNRRNDSPNRQMVKGWLMMLIVITVSSGIPLLLLILAYRIHPVCRVILETVMCWQLLATKSLKDESMKVYKKLERHDLQGSRKAVSMIVGRDTDVLDESGVTKATVETIAENTSDGVIAPMLYMAIGGAFLGWMYKSINTMDSMVAYKNDRYLYFGRIPAYLDDVVNYIPARLSGLLMIAATFLVKLDGVHAFAIFKRDRYNHASPNSAQTEAVMAGALNVQLAGDAWYFGELYKKKTIGVDIRPIEAADIVRANKLLYGTAVVSLVVFSLVKYLVLMI